MSLDFGPNVGAKDRKESKETLNFCMGEACWRGCEDDEIWFWMCV